MRTYIIVIVLVCGIRMVSGSGMEDLLMNNETCELMSKMIIRNNTLLSIITLTPIDADYIFAKSVMKSFNSTKGDDCLFLCPWSVDGEDAFYLILIEEEFILQNNTDKPLNQLTVQAQRHRSRPIIYDDINLGVDSTTEAKSGAKLGPSTFLVEGLSFTERNGDHSLKWLNTTKMVLQVLTCILLTIAAVITGLRRRRTCCYLLFVLFISLDLVIAANLLKSLLVMTPTAHIILGIVEHYLWFVSAIATLTITWTFCKGQKTPSQPVKEQWHYAAMSSKAEASLAVEFSVLFIIPIAYMAPLPLIENYLVHRIHHSFNMVKVLAHVYTEREDNLHVVMEFVGPLALISILNIIGTVVRISRGMSARCRVTAILLALVNITLSLLYVCWNGHCTVDVHSHYTWLAASLGMVFLLDISLAAIFLINTSLCDQLLSTINHRRRTDKRQTDRCRQDSAFTNFGASTSSNCTP